MTASSAPGPRGLTRAELLLAGALGAASVYGAAAAGPAVTRALAQSSTIDLEVAKFALLLERLEQRFYQDARRRVPDLSPRGEELAETLYNSESQHVEALGQLVQQLGGAPGQAPKFDYGNAFDSEDAFLSVALTLEETGVSAYNGAAPLIEDREILATAGQIVQVEARHATRVRILRGEDTAPTAFDVALEMDQVLDRAKPFIRNE